jgi:hypothetical protein
LDKNILIIDEVKTNKAITNISQIEIKNRNENFIRSCEEVAKIRESFTETLLETRYNAANSN